VEKTEGLISDFHLDTILVIMEHHKSLPEDMRKFIKALNTLKGLRVYHLTLSDRVQATQYMEKFNLKYDDALAIQVMKRFKIKQTVSTISSLKQLQI
jgi:predicted nucleic acid-binding protein